MRLQSFLANTELADDLLTTTDIAVAIVTAIALCFLAVQKLARGEKLPNDLSK